MSQDRITTLFIRAAAAMAKARKMRHEALTMPAEQRAEWMHEADAIEASGAACFGEATCLMLTPALPYSLEVL